MTTTTIKNVRNQLTSLKKAYMSYFATDEQKHTAFKNATLLLVNKMGYKHWLSSNLVELFFTQQVELCRTKIEMIGNMHGDDVVEMFDKALDELSYDFVWYKEHNGGMKYTTNKYLVM